jgi:CubicO group peptidase (beta-lactamase class C family)
LQGLWVSDVRTERPRGELVVRHEGAVWNAHFGAAEVQFESNADDIVFRFSENIGAFRGALSRDRRSIDGFWIQAGDQGQPLAIPTVLRLGRHGEWRGDVAPLGPRFTLYLRIFARDDGVLIGAFRNPQRNTTGGGSRLFVQREGGNVRFLERVDGEAGVVHQANVLTAPDRIRLFWPQSGESLDLVRQPPENAPGFFPRPPGSPPYTYNRPEQTNDGWRTGRARNAGFDESALSALVQRIVDVDPSERRPALIHSLLVARRGRLVLEEYFFGHDRDALHDTRSAGKTFASVMLGAVMRRGVDISPQSAIAPLLAGPVPFENMSASKDRITLAHLMTHTSGLACNDNDEASPGNEDTMQAQQARSSWQRYALDLPMTHEPGERYAYCSAGMNLVGGALTAATGAWLPTLFERTIARPLQFGAYAWNLAPDGEGYLGGGVRLRPRDLLKLGQTYLDGGVWRGRRIVSRDWVAQSTSPHIEISPQTTGLSEEEFANSYVRGSDGYAWHRYGIRVGDRVVEEYEANGNGGQFLIVVPEYELVVVLTGGNYNHGFIWGRWRDEIVGGAIIAAIRR